MGMADVAGRLGAASAVLQTMGDQLADTSDRATPHFATELASTLDASWAAQLELTKRLGDELMELAASIRIAAQRYVEADQGF
jgi:uncharacterized protein YukE